MTTEQPSPKSSIREILRAIKSMIAVLYRTQPKEFLKAILLLLLVPLPIVATVKLTNDLFVAITAKAIPDALHITYLLGIAMLAQLFIGYLRSRNNFRMIIMTMHEFERLHQEHVMSVSMRVLEDSLFRKAHAQVQKDLYTIRDILGKLQGLLGALLKSFGWGSMFYYLPWQISLIIGAGITSYFFTIARTYRIESQIHNLRKERNLRSQYYNSRLHILTQQANIRTNQLSSFFHQFFINIDKSLRQQLIELRLKEATNDIIRGLFEPAAIIVGLLLLIPLLANDTPPSHIITFYSLVKLFWDNLNDVTHNLLDLASAVPFMLTYNELMSFGPEPKGTKKLLQKPIHVAFQNVSFRYTPDSDDVLIDLNLSFSLGDQLALIGLNGAGKSTLLKLLVGLYQPTKGRILINGTNLAELDIEQWRSKLSYMDQSVPHYDDTLIEQIHYGNLERPIDKKRLTTALHVSGFDEIVNEFPKGLETHAGRQYANKDEHPIELSGGQNQLLAIARTLYRKADLYIFDEPTSAVDAMKEEQFFNRLPAALEGKTLLFISHRFSTVRRAKRILVLSSGSIVEDGTHEELMKKEGLYHELFQIQAKAYSET